MSRSGRVVSFAIVLLACAQAALTASENDLGVLEERTFREAVDRVVPNLVQIDIFRVGQRQTTTGVQIDGAGSVLTSRAGFEQPADSILVRDAAGSRRPATLLATDAVRQLALLHAEGLPPAPTLEFVAPEERRVGQWTIAIGRTFGDAPPFRSVGILSAQERLGGLALQTDAKISPHNYGGPLVDLRGRLLGLIVPLSPVPGDDVSNWYDSGIGFAIPWEDLAKVLSRLSRGESLRPGRSGLTFANANSIEPVPPIDSVRPGSPAAQAGFKAQDQIIAIDGRNVERFGELQSAIETRYAGDSLAISFNRSGERKETRLTLSDELPVYRHLGLGVFPALGNGEGITVRAVCPGSPAARSGVLVGDVLRGLTDEKLASREAWSRKLLEAAPGDTLEIDLVRNGKRLIVKSTLSAIDGSWQFPEPTQQPEGPATVETVEAKEFETSYQWIAPATIAAGEDKAIGEHAMNAAPGIVVWLSDAPANATAQTIADAWGVATGTVSWNVMVPQSREGRWEMRELAVVRHLIERRLASMPGARVVVVGEGGAAKGAWLLAATSRDWANGVVFWHSALPSRAAENDPAHRLLIATTETSPPPAQAEQRRAARRLEERGFAVFTLPDPAAGNAGTWQALARWLDGVDCL